MLAYAEQSARLRAKRLGGVHEQAYATFVNWANAEAARNYQIATGEAVHLPPALPVDYDALSAVVLESKSPL